MMNLHQAPDSDAHESLRPIEERVQRGMAGQVRDFRLVLRNGGLVLLGRARTYYAKQMATQSVMAATKMPICANEIEVSSSAGGD